MWYLHFQVDKYLRLKKLLKSSRSPQMRIFPESNSLWVQKAHLHGPEGGGVIVLLSQEDMPPEHRHMHQMTHVLLHLGLYLGPALIDDVCEAQPHWNTCRADRNDKESRAITHRAAPCECTGTGSDRSEWETVNHRCVQHSLTPSSQVYSRSWFCVAAHLLRPPDQSLLSRTSLWNTNTACHLQTPSGPDYSSYSCDRTLTMKFNFLPIRLCFTNIYT